eukprot:799566-Pelagomonas_calceolata.AAC.3
MHTLERSACTASACSAGACIAPLREKQRCANSSVMEMPVVLSLVQPGHVTAGFNSMLNSNKQQRVEDASCARPLAARPWHMHSWL